MDAAPVGVLPPGIPTVDGKRSLQLDLFRGLAAIFMIVNHSGYTLIGAAASSDGWPAWLVFVGSAAPALFFFATGVGAGFSAGGRETVASISTKVALLLLADMLMNWSGGTLLGLDFFGFAAIATLVLFLVRGTRRPMRVAAVLLALVLVARFALVIPLRGRIAPDSVLAFVTGIASVHHVSYPLAPWLAFPLIGFQFGRRWRQGATLEETSMVGLCGLLALGTFAALASHGASVFRWGSVSVAYFLCAVGIVMVAWLATRWFAAANPEMSRSVALRGPASLLIVPLHYGALGLVEAAWQSPRSMSAWLATTILLVVCVLALSRTLVAWARRINNPGWMAQILIGGSTCGIAWLACQSATPLLRLEVCSLGEVLIALLLLWSSSSRGSAGRAVSGTPFARLP